MMSDRLGRALRDLRISVTDRCNFRCRYCMPREAFGRDHAFLPRAQLLTYEEITRVARAAVALGATKLRITGGEPLVRQEVPRLVAMLRQAAPAVELALTTNGALLAQHARALADAGLQRVNVSLDSLDEAVFSAMTDSDCTVSQVLGGIDAAAGAGLTVKVNAVVQRGVNDHTVVALARHFRERGIDVRFIEYMDVGNSNGWSMRDVVPASAIVAMIDAAHPLEPIDPRYGGEVAQRYRYRDGGGEVGVIASVTQPFCGDCTRLRLSPEGQLFTCLFAGQGHDLRRLLRGGADDAQVRQFIADLWHARDDRYSETRTRQTFVPLKVEMSRIGG
jgi:cyclic pyranopterin phosphate synthase